MQRYRLYIYIPTLRLKTYTHLWSNFKPIVYIILFCQTVRSQSIPEGVAIAALFWYWIDYFHARSTRGFNYRHYGGRLYAAVYGVYYTLTLYLVAEFLSISHLLHHPFCTNGKKLKSTEIVVTLIVLPSVFSVCIIKIYLKKTNNN